MSQSHHTPVLMERFFDAAYRDDPAIHIGSRTLPLFSNSAYEQAFESVHLAYTKPGDAIVLRNADPEYLVYWRKLVGDVHVYNHLDSSGKRFLSDVVLEDRDMGDWLRANAERIKQLAPSRAKLYVFFSTEKEQRIAQALHLPLYGSPAISRIYGTKSGIRMLAQATDIPMAPGIICASVAEIETAIRDLFSNKSVHQIVVKSDQSIGGEGCKRLQRQDIARRKNLIDLLSTLTAQFEKGGNVAVVEVWQENAQATVCTHIEIRPDGNEPIIRWGWQQRIAADQVSYQGADPLMLSYSTIQRCITQTSRLAAVLKSRGAVGSYAPNFLVTQQDEILLLELNTRVPLSAFGLSIIQQLKGTIGDGFVIQYVQVPFGKTFRDIRGALMEADILIQEPKGAATEGVVPFNAGLLRYGSCTMVAMAASYDKANVLMKQAERILQG